MQGETSSAFNHTINFVLTPENTTPNDMASFIWLIDASDAAAASGKRRRGKVRRPFTFETKGRVDAI